MNIEESLDHLHAKVSRNVLFQKFTQFTRAILAVGFFAPGLHKLMGIPFTTIPVENPIGAFFNALFQTGFYYRYLGAAQVLAAVLVAFRATATLGALMFFGITMNVFIITISIPFGWGTPIVTGLMFLASIYLVCWDYPKIKPILPFFSNTSQTATDFAVNGNLPTGAPGKFGYWLFIIAGNILMCELRGLFMQGGPIKGIALILCAIGGIVMAGGFVADIIRKRPLWNN